MKIDCFEYVPEDFDGYVECLNSFYHGRHPYPKYFQKDFLENLINEKKLIITLAKTEDGKIIGTSTAQRLEGIFENSVMLGMRYLSEEYRGMGIGNKQEDFLLALVKERFPDACSVYGDVVMHNEISQRTLYKKGFRFCGVNMMFFREPSYPSKYEEEDFKLSMAVFVKGMSKKRVTVNPPEKYADKILEIYNSLGVPAETEHNEYSGKTEYSFEVLDKHNTTEFFVTLPGNDNREFLKNADARLMAGDTVSVYIDMETFGCEKIVHELENRGFFFCGIKPLNEHREFLLMCNTQNHKGNKNNIQIPDECREIANYFIGGIR